MSKMMVTNVGLVSSRLSRAGTVAREIEREIEARSIVTGGRLGTKAELKHRFRVAAATVNEAVKLLDARGLVEARPGPGGGLFVAEHGAFRCEVPMIMGFEWAEASMDEYNEVRQLLEPKVNMNACHNITESDIADLQQIIDSMSKHLDIPYLFIRDNSAFHKHIASLTTNVPLRSCFLTLVGFCEHAFERAELPKKLDPENLDVHIALLAALATGDEGLVKVASAQHDSDRLQPTLLLEAFSESS